MKRSGPIQRTTRLRSTGRLKTVGATKLKKQKRYKAFLSSAVWKRIRKAALERAGYRCETTYAACVDADTGRPLVEYGLKRCPETDRLTVHHLTYARFGGDEIPSDLKALCRECHNALHASEGKRIA